MTTIEKLTQSIIDNETNLEFGTLRHLAEIDKHAREQQKKIDELKMELEDTALRKLSAEQHIDAFKALNPNVPCPMCEGNGAREYTGNLDILGVACGTCNATGTVALTKAQEYRIKELETELEGLRK
jgi:DnaJ-class molecular chaperone